jgi:hypothetical protein
MFGYDLGIITEIVIFGGFALFLLIQVYIALNKKDR